MASPLTQIALSSLRASQAGLATSGHNIANVNTEGYTRQDAVMASARPTFSGSGYLGNGVQVQAVRRAYVGQIDSQVRMAGSDYASASARAEGLDRLNTLMGDTDSGIPGAMSGFFSAADALAADPAGAATRQTFLASARTLAQRFKDTQARLADDRMSVNRDIKATVDEVNVYSRQVADLNVAISGETKAGRTPNDLIDQRELLLRKLADRLSIQPVEQEDGTVNVFLGTGQSLVVSGSAYGLATTPDEFRADAPRVGLKLGSEVTPLPGAELLGGRLGGLLSYRDEALTAAEAGIGRLAASIASAVNAQHRAGVDASGAADADLFSIDAPMVTASSANTGSAGVTATIADASALAASEYKLSWDGAQWSALSSADGSRKTFASLPATIDGLTIAGSGTPAAGDSFLVSAVRTTASSINVAIKQVTGVAAGQGAASGDGRNAQALAGLGDANIAQSASATGAWSALIADLGARGHEAGLAQSAAETLSTSLTTARESVAGVNLDEEAMNIMRFQQAFQAAGKLASVANTLFDSVLEIVR